MSDESFWESQRRLIPSNPRKINLNAGTLWPTPWPVLDAVSELRREMAADPSHFMWRRSPVLLQGARNRLAAYLNCSELDLLLLANATIALNIVCASLDFPPGSEILTTDHEYGAMIYCWNRVAQRRGWTIRQIELPFRSENPEDLVHAFARQIRSQTQVLYFSHVTTTTGVVLPAGSLSALAREQRLLCVIDGAHAPGMVNVNLADIDADCYMANCHKWMMAPAGAGFLHVSARFKPRLQSLITSWGYDYDRAHPDDGSIFGGTNWQGDFEFHGTLDRCPQLVIPQALDFRVTLGGEAAIAARVRELSDYARHALSGCGFKCATPQHPMLRGALTAFDFPCNDPIAARELFYQRHDVECPVTVACGKSFLRVSTAWFNTPEQIDHLAQAAVAVAQK